MKPRALIFALVFSLYLVATCANATPFFSIGEGGDTSWTDAIASGNVQGVNPGDLTDVANSFYSQQVANDPNINSFQQVPVTLTPDINVSDGNETHQSLVMSWDGIANDTLDVAAWQYVYGVDPDLTNTMIHFSIFAPPGIWDLSLELIDANGLSRGWFLSMPPNVWQNAWIRPDIAAVQGPFNFFFNQPGFDITQVVAIRLDEAGNNAVFPITDPTLNGTAWNAWNHLSVSPIPEPATLSLLSLGLAGIGYRRYCKKIAA